MPVEPPPSAWVFPDLGDPAVERGCPDDLVAHGADLESGTLLAAYRSGVFPMPIEDSRGKMLWWSPQRRAVVPLQGLRVSRSLARACRRFEVRVDTSFGEVVAACADPARPSGWITTEIAEAYAELHRLGWAHSVETWDGDELVGGLYGVAIGGLFAGESMFHRASDASKVALVGLVKLLVDEDPEVRLLDVQWLTPHLESLGAVELPRPAYLRALRAALDLPLPAPWR